jgi:hypothetical protein
MTDQERAALADQRLVARLDRLEARIGLASDLVDQLGETLRQFSEAMQEEGVTRVTPSTRP